MKRLLHSLLIMISIGAYSINSMAQVMAPDSVSMLASYKDEVYYNMQSGIVKFTARDQWDISFRTRVMSSSILINDGTGVVLYTYPHTDTTGWATVDTTGLSTWTPMYNDPNDWENGAFSRNQLGYPDYGWGQYNTVSHDVVGDSLFVIRLRNGACKKLWIQRKQSGADTWYFRYANLDGTRDTSVVKDITPFLVSDFYGFNMENGTWVNYNPPMKSWDIVFTKYMGINSGVPYPVTGVLSNDSVKANRFHPVPLTYSDFLAEPWDSTRSPIGYDWKIFNSGTSTYDLKDSLVYFVKSRSGSVYKLYFTKFEGSSTGKIVFMKGKIPGVGISDIKSNDTNINIYPNPANQVINLYFTQPIAEDAIISLSDITGKSISRNEVGAGTLQYSLSSVDLRAGIYFVTVTLSAGRFVKKVIISH